MTNTPPNLRTTIKILPANSETPIDAPGSMVQCMTSSGAGGNLQVRLGDGQANRFDPGDKYTLKKGTGFDKVFILNNTGAPITTTIGLGDGDITQSNAATITNLVTVTDAAAEASLAQIHVDAGTTIPASIATGNTSLAALVTALNALTSSRISPSIDLTGMTYAEQTAAGTNNVVTAGANTAGIWIAIGGVAADSTVDGAAINVQTHSLLTTGATGAATNGGCPSLTIQNVFIPAANALDLVNVGGAITSKAYVWYKKF